MPAQPGLQQASLVGGLEGRQSATGQADLLAIPGICWHRKGFQGDVDQLLLLFFVLGQPFGCGRDAGRRTRMKVFQHGQHFGTHTIAAESGIGVARIDPDGQAPLVAEASRVLPAEGEQGAHQGTILGQGPGGPQRGQPAAVAASGEVEQQGFRPIAGGVAREHMPAAERLRLTAQAVVPPLARLRLRCRHGGGPLPEQGKVLGHRPGGQLLPLGGGLRAPAMVAMPEVELPAMERAQVLQQADEGHGVLPAGDGHQQAGVLGEQGGVAEQVPVEPVLVGPPGAAPRGIGWENQVHNLGYPQMSRHSSLPAPLREGIRQQRLLKVIAGLTNRDPIAVARIARAAAAGGADLLDLACDPSLVEGILAVAPGLPLCVSAVDPALFPAAVAAGASMVEIGNFDAFYPQGLRFEADDVLRLTHRTRELLPDVVLSVTVPHVLPLDQQEQLAVALAQAGADWIQTEGGTSARPVNAGVLGLIEKAAPTLAATHAISRALAAAEVPLPVLCASGLSAVTVPMALAAGASGVGVGSAVNRLRDEVAMVAVVRALREAIAGAVAPARPVA